MPKWSAFVGGLSVDTIGGSERIPILDTTPLYITPALVSAYVIDQIHGADAITSLTDTHQLSVFTSADDEKIITFANVKAWIVDQIEASSTGTSIVSGDTILYSDGGVLKQINVDTVATYINSAVLDLTSLVAATPGSSDLFLFGSGSTPRKITLANLETQLWTDFATYVAGLTKVTTTAANDVIFCIQGGTAKYVTPTELATFVAPNSGDVTGPVSTTQNNIPQWSATTKDLTDGLSLVTTLRTVAGGASDTALASEQAIAEFVGDITTLDIAGGADIGAALADADLIIVDDGGAGTQVKCAMSRVRTYIAANSVTDLDIDGAADIGAALADADLIVVDDGALGTNRKSAMSRVFTYIETKIQGLSAKTTPVDADILMIQDSAAANALKELTIANLKTLVLTDVAITNIDLDGGADIGADLADADLILVDDGAGGTNRKSAMSRVWTYITGKLQATPNKSTPVDADRIVIQDSENLDALSELTVGNLWDNRFQADMLAVTSLATAAWLLDEDNMASNSATKVPSQQSVKAYVDNVAGTFDNLSASANPTVNNDVDEGYSPGSRWINLTTDAAWICVDNTDGAAVWQSMTAAAAGWDGDIADVVFTTGADIGADLADGDRIIIGDASDSNNPKRSEVSRVKTYIKKQDVATYAANQTLTTAECHGYVIYVTGAATITLPAAAAGMNVVIKVIGAVAVSVDPNAVDKIRLDGTALDDGDKIDCSTSGGIVHLNYYSADGWDATSDGNWTDGGV